ncbi:MAG: TlpA family protein disulfide reductase [Acidobacteriota bacterium]|nr:TlpA family protein disulfide reductase [Acidobacteriota bacterium]
MPHHSHQSALRCRRFSLARMCLVACVTLALGAACSRTRPIPESAKQAAAKTPTGTTPPQTALPMPPIPVVPSRGSDTGVPVPQSASTSQVGWTMLDGRRARPADYRGQVLVLDFWATYCPPCREQTPHLIALQRRYGAQGLQVVGINVGGDEDRPKVAGFVEQYGIQYPLGYPDQAMSELYFSDTSAIPQTYIFDRTGRLAKRFVGYDTSTSTELEQVIKDALSAAAPTD